MNINEILEVVFKVVILPLIPLIVVYLKTLIQTKTEELKVKTENELIDKYLDMANDILLRCVTETTQVYVSECKKNNAFTKEAQLEALNRTKSRFEDIATEEIKDVILEVTGDYEAWINASIETLVNQKK